MDSGRKSVRAGRVVAMLAVAFCLLIAVPGFASADDTGTIRGRVIDSVTREPLSGVTVIWGHHIGGGAYDTSDSMTTGSDGVYEFPALVPGEYMIFASDPSTKHQDLYYRNAPTWQTLEHVVVAAEAITTPDDIAMRPFGHITGHAVRRSTGEDVAGVTVQAFAAGNNSTVIDSASTDASGNYTLTHVLAGSYHLKFTDPSRYAPHAYCDAMYPGIYDFFVDATRGEAVTVEADGTTTTVPLDMPLARNGTVTASAVDWQSGDPASGYFFTAWSPEGGGFPYGNGAWEMGPVGSTLTIVPPGNWYIGFYFLPGPFFDYQYYRDDQNTSYFDNAQAFTVYDGEDISATGRLLPKTPVAGRVTRSDTGAGVSGAKVEPFVKIAGAWTLAATGIQTGDDGSWSFAGLPPDTYRFKFTPPEGSRLVPLYYCGSSSVASDVALPPFGNLTGIDQELSSDTTPPVTTATVAPDAARASWSNASTATVTLGATDGANGIGVASTGYRLGSSPTTSTYSDPIKITAEGVTTVWFASTDTFDNAENLKRVDVHIDRTAPLTADNHKATYDLSATIKLTPSDARSGVATTQWSMDGGAWVTGTSVATTKGGSHVLKVRSTDKAGNMAVARQFSFVVRTKPTIGTPSAPASMYRTKSYTVYGYLKPRHTAGTYPVRIYKYRYVSGRWKSYGYVTAKASTYSTYTKYSLKLRLPYKGKWKVRAYAIADSLHVGAWSAAYDYVTVK